MRVATFYRFVDLESAVLVSLRSRLQAVGDSSGLRGTILLAEEGVNATVCGPACAVEALFECLEVDPRLAALPVKFSSVSRQVFHRLKVRIRREIVSMGCPWVRPASRVGTYVPPGEWDELLASPDTLLIDTRNRYEVELGSFEGAVQPDTTHFREFPQWVNRDLPRLMEQRGTRQLALFCTGGIRCEKATSLLLEEGFSGVHHLEGGILRYLEEIPPPRSRWTGECFVFDQRVTVDHQLQEGTHVLCHACRMPLSSADLSHPSYREGVSCRHCLFLHTPADRRRFQERHRQVRLAQSRGEEHIGRVFC